MSGTQIFLRLTRECLRFRVRIALILISLVSLGGARLYLPWLLKLGITALNAGDRATIARLWIEGALTTVVLITALFASRYLLNSVNQSLVQHLRDAAQRRLLTMGVAAGREFRSGELMSRLFNDAGLLAGFVRDILKRLVGESIVVVGGIALMFYLQWQLALATCVMLPVVGLLLNGLGGLIRRMGTRAQRDIGALTAILNEQVRGLTTIKGYQTEAYERQRFARQNARYRRQVMRGERWAALLVASVSAVGAGVLFVILWYGSQQVLGNRVAAETILAFCLYAVQTIEPIRRLSEVHGLLQNALAAAARVYEVIDLPAVEPEGEVRLPVPARGELRFEGVRFRYRADEPVLEGVDLSVVPGEAVAVVAASGGGKSTMAGLLLRFFDPGAGRILLDGIDLRALRLADLRRAVCVVEQDPFIFSGPLIDNLRYGSWDAPTSAITSAVALAGLEPLVRALPGGLRAPLLEAGRDLSGGQKQRIALARALVRDPAVLVLDEATSALDSDTEGQIFAQLDGWLRRRTVVVMAHRLATVSRFERIVVLEGGRAVGDGSVAQLVRSCPAFGQLFAEQLAPLSWPRAVATGGG